MRKFIGRITRKVTATAVKAKSALRCKRGEGYIGEALKILIAVVLGALLLAGLFLLFNSTILPTVTQKVSELFNFSG